jgi:ankyrin repeat protein
MKNLPPLLGLLYDFRHDNSRFHYLSKLVMEDGLSAFLKEYRDKDSMYDAYSKVSLLHMAAASGKKETIQHLIEQGIPINVQDKEGNTPLHFAALCGYEAGVEYLLALGANRTITNKHQLSPWHVARTGKLLHLLIPEDKRKEYASIPDKSLYEAVDTKDIDATRRLLEMGIHPNLLNHEDHQVEFRLPLHIAVDKKNIKLVKLLLENGAKPSAPYINIHVPLESAINQKNTKMVQLLLKYGADPNHKLRNSLLHLATRNNLLKIMELLLQHRADPEVQVEGHYFYHPPLRDAQSVEAIRLLLKYGAETVPEKMKDFLVWPIGKGQVDVIREFIRIGVPVRSADLWNNAIRGSYHHDQMMPICKLLLEAGLDVNLSIKYYGSPLIRAIRYRDLELVKLFLQYGADVQTTDPDGKSPYEIAISSLQKDISDLLAQHLQDKGLPIPAFQAAPAVDTVKHALEQGRTDLIQLSLYDSNVDSPHKQFETLKGILSYSVDALPFQVLPKEEEEEEIYEEWDENYQPPLSDYQVIFHPKDPRCFILMVSWYDDFAYSTVYHLHVRCKKKYGSTIKELFENWFPSSSEEEWTDDDFEMIKHYKLGTYLYEFDQSEKTEEEIERLNEVEHYYLEAVKEIHKNKIAPV